MPIDQDAVRQRNCAECIDDAEERHPDHGQDFGEDFPSDSARHAREDCLAIGDVPDHDALPPVLITVAASRYASEPLRPAWSGSAVRREALKNVPVRLAIA